MPGSPTQVTDRLITVIRGSICQTRAVWGQNRLSTLETPILSSATSLQEPFHAWGAYQNRTTLERQQRSSAAVPTSYRTALPHSRVYLSRQGRRLHAVANSRLVPWGELPGSEWISGPREDKPIFGRVPYTPGPHVHLRSTYSSTLYFHRPRLKEQIGSARNYAARAPANIMNGDDAGGHQKSPGRISM